MLTSRPSPFTLSSTGSVIAASLITGLRPDLPGIVTGQVTERVFDSATDRILLIPQGARLIGTYDSVVAFGQVNTRHWRAALKRAGITNFRWHDLRHTWASWLRQSDVPTWVLQELGGWKSETMVRRYAHMSVKHLQPYADQLIFEGKSGHTAPEREKAGQGHKNGHSESRFRLKLVAETDLSN